jgi:hypothetical protein
MWVIKGDGLLGFMKKGVMLNREGVLGVGLGGENGEVVYESKNWGGVKFVKYLRMNRFYKEWVLLDWFIILN